MMATVGTLTPTSRVGLATGTDSIYRTQAPVRTNRAGVIPWGVVGYELPKAIYGNRSVVVVGGKRERKCPR